MNTWGGEGSVKSYNNSSVLPIQGGSKIEYDTLGQVPMGQNLEGTSKNLNRRIRY